MLLDFDWGGEEGDAFYPTLNLNDELLEDRKSIGQRIAKDDDLRVLKNTLDQVMARLVPRRETEEWRENSSPLKIIWERNQSGSQRVAAVKNVIGTTFLQSMPPAYNRNDGGASDHEDT